MNSSNPISLYIGFQTFHPPSYRYETPKIHISWALAFTTSFSHLETEISAHS